MKTTPHDAPFPEETGFGIYVHWPFCAAKCPYCDFNSYARQSLSEERYLDALCAELSFYAELTGRREATSVFLGGGTPSLMSARLVGRIVERIADLWPLRPGAEITLEANPSSVEAGRFRDYRAAGVNRVSVGVQSLSDAALRFLGRLHSAEEARTAIAVANAVFDRVSFDLIYALPGQSPADWARELREALGLSAGHLSLYQLTIEPGTAFFDLERRGRLSIPEGETAAALYEATQELCEAAGLPAYEISNHAAPGAQSRHNLAYWRYSDYVGAGPGAHGRLRTKDGKFAFSALRDPAAWAAAVETRRHGAEESAPLSPRHQAEEALLMGLRLAEGVSLQRMRTDTGFVIAATALEGVVSDGLAILGEEGRLTATARGRLLLDSLAAHLASALAPAEAAQYCEMRPPLKALGAGSIT